MKLTFALIVSAAVYAVSAAPADDTRPLPQCPADQVVSCCLAAPGQNGGPVTHSMCKPSDSWNTCQQNLGMSGLVICCPKKDQGQPNDDCT